MKKLIYLVIILAAITYFYPTEPGSALYSIQAKIKSSGKSKSDYISDLTYKQQELKAYEKAIVDITNNLENEIENAPVCPTTGEKARITIKDDPRVELKEKCDLLKKEIQALKEIISNKNA